MLNGLAGELRRLADSIEAGDIRVDRWEIERGCIPGPATKDGFLAWESDGLIHVSLELKVPGNG